MAIGSPKDIAIQGEKIYQDKYRDTYEKQYPGKFVAIEIETGEAFVADSAEKAIQAAQKARDGGLFHLIKVGSSGAFHVSSLLS
jgi:hypothetical protein